MEKIRKLPSIALIGIVKLYQIIIRPYLGYRCRFYPSCSCYAVEALKQYGCFGSSLLIISRIFRCHPFSKGGNDPVPKLKITPQKTE